VRSRITAPPLLICTRDTRPASSPRHHHVAPVCTAPPVDRSLPVARRLRPARECLEYLECRRVVSAGCTTPRGGTVPCRRGASRDFPVSQLV